MATRIKGLTILAAIGLATAITACENATSSATSASTATSAAASSPVPQASPAVANPAGDHRIGGATQGISIEVPASFTLIDLGSLTSAQASISRLGLTGASATTIAQSIPSIQKLHGVMAVDGESAAANHGFASNINAYCVNSGTDLTGSAVVPALKQNASVLQQQLGATNVTTTDEQIGGVPGVETSYRLHSSTYGTINGVQLEVAAKPHKACFATLTAPPSSDEIISVAAASAEFF